MRLAITVLAVLLVAGCSSPEPVGTSGTATTGATGAGTTGAGTTEPDPTGTGAPTGPQRFNKTFELSHTEAYGFSRTAAGTNCIRFAQEFTWLRGTATATWTPQSPAAQSLQLLGGAFGEEYTKTAGSSPLALTITTPFEGAEGIIAVQLASPGGVAQQAVTLELSFDYTGEEPVGRLGSCAISS